MQKATPVQPPVREEIIEVDMTTTYFVMSALTVSTVGLGVTTAVLWRRSKKNEEKIEAISEYVSRLINRTEVGRVAYQTLIDDIEKEEKEEEVADFSDEVGIPHAEQASRAEGTDE